MSNIDKYKNSISEKYIQDFKKELGFFEKIMILPISKKMEEILKSNKKIDVDNLGELEDLGFWRKVLGVKIGDKGLFEKLTGKVFNFLKEKQEKIIKAETNGQLEQLQNLVINDKLDDLEKDVDYVSQENDSDDSKEGDSDNKKEDEHGEKKDGEGDSDKFKVNPKIAGATTGIVGGAGYYAGVRKLENLAGIRNAKEIPNGFDVVRTKKLMQDISLNLAEKSKSPKINRSMKASYEKSIKVFNESAGSLNDDVGKAFMERQKLGSKLPESTLKSLNVNRKFTGIIDAMADDDLAKIVGKNSDEIKSFFKISKGIDISDDLAKQLKLAEHFSDLRGMNSAFKNASKLSKLSKGFKGMGAISVIGLGVDVWVYFETMKEVDAVKKINDIRGEVINDRANMQLGIGFATLAAEALTIIGVCAAGGAMGGPLGLAVGLAVGAASFATSVLVDELYYEKKDFYAQNRYDNINKDRTTIKQAIVQLLESDRLGMHEKMRANVKEDAKEKGKELNTMEYAREALIYQEELSNSWYQLPLFYSSGKSEEIYEKELLESEPDNYKIYMEEKQKMENIIKVRMEYIKNYIQKDKETPEYKSMKDMISQSKGIEYVENVLANSKIYEYIKSEHQDAYIQDYKNMTVEEYKNSYKERLKLEYPDKFEIFERLSVENPVHLYEICVGAEASTSSIESGMVSDPDNQNTSIYSAEEMEIIKPNLDFIKRYFEYRKLGKSVEKSIKTGFDSKDMSRDLDYNYIQQILLDITSINQRPLISKPEHIQNYFSSHENFTKRLNTNLQVSNDTGQNILYSIASEFHGYSGDNQNLDIINFYNAGNQDSTGIYYDNGWRINKDLDRNQKFKYLFTGQIIPMIIAGLDVKFDLREIDSKNMTADQVYNRIINGEIWTKFITEIPGQILGKSEGLDSSIEAADSKVIEEFKMRTKEIIDREIGYRDQKEVYEKKLVDFIKIQCSDKEGYVEIPYDLIIECKKAKIGDIENYLFKIENGEIVALSIGASVNEILNFDKTKQEIKYEALTPLREEITNEEKAIIEKVSMSHNRLEDIRTLQSGWSNFWNTHRDELGIPIALEKEISNKWLEREKIERSLLHLSPASAKMYLQENWEIYYSYFEDTYIGMMATISQFKISDDLGDIDHMNKAWSWVGRDIIEVKDNAITIPESIILEDDEKYYLLKYTKELKDADTNKTAEQLLLATKDDEKTGMSIEDQKEKGKWMVKQILISVLEAETIYFDTNGKPKSISCNADEVDEKIVDDKIGYWQYPESDPQTGYSTGETKFVELEPSKNRKMRVSMEKMEERMKIYLGYNSTISVKNGLKELNTASITTNPQSIRDVSESEVTSYKSINELTDKIIKTKDMVDWAGRRGNPEFIPDHKNITQGNTPGSFESRGNSVKISVHEKDGGNQDGKNNIYLKIEGLDVNFSLEEGLRMANQINWTKDYISRNPYNKGKLFYGSSGALFAKDATWRSMGLHDTSILKIETMMTYYPKMLDNNRDNILSYLNSL